jgi:acyl-coenzyme A thioesterase PaaI-like protein
MDGGSEERQQGDPVVQIAEGDWAGWWAWMGGDPFEDMIGPFYWRHLEDGRVECAFRAEPRHMNGGGFMHGGCLMTFADYCLFVWAREALGDRHGVTATFSSEFVGSVRPGAFVSGKGEIIKAGKSLIFVRGLITGDGEPALTFSGVIKQLGPR